MNNIFVYCENEEGKVADVSLELLTKGRVWPIRWDANSRPSYWDTTWPVSKKSWPSMEPTAFILPTVPVWLLTERCPMQR